MADKIDVIRSRICAAEHIIGADGNVKSAAHFFIQNGITAQFRHIGVHAKAKLADNFVLQRLFLEKDGDFGMAAAAYLPVRNMQQNLLVFCAVKVESFKINCSPGFVLHGNKSKYCSL